MTASGNLREDRRLSSICIIISSILDSRKRVVLFDIQKDPLKLEYISPEYARDHDVTMRSALSMSRFPWSIDIVHDPSPTVKCGNDILPPS